MSKTLSNGTLSLRFMQNAQRTKDPLEVKPGQASLVDDAEWHVPQNVRDAWTTGNGDAPATSAAVSEQSYLPFLFHAEDKETPFKGRRCFVRGKEVIPTSSQQPEPVPSSDPPQQANAKVEPGSVSGGTGAGRSHRDGTFIKPKGEKKPVSISGFRSSGPATSSSRSPGKKPALPANSLIYQDTDVGVDLRSTRHAASRQTGFVKPAGVDAPPQDSQLPKDPVSLPVVENDGTKFEPKKRSIDGTDNSTRFTNAQEDGLRKKRKK